MASFTFNMKSRCKQHLKKNWNEVYVQSWTDAHDINNQYLFTKSIIIEIISIYIKSKILLIWNENA